MTATRERGGSKQRAAESFAINRRGGQWRVVLRRSCDRCCEVVLTALATALGLRFNGGPSEGRDHTAVSAIVACREADQVAAADQCSRATRARSAETLATQSTWGAAPPHVRAGRHPNAPGSGPARPVHAC